MSKILDFITKSKNDKNFAQAYLKETYSKLEKQKNNNAYITLVKDYKYVIDNSKSLINKIPYAIKDNINALDTITTGGSLFFKNYNSPYSATVIDNLNKAGAIPVAKANLDEFSCHHCVLKRHEQVLYRLFSGKSAISFAAWSWLSDPDKARDSVSRKLQTIRKIHLAHTTSTECLLPNQL